MTVERSNRCLFCIINGNNKGRAHILELSLPIYEVSSPSSRVRRVERRGALRRRRMTIPLCTALYQACLQPASVSSSICWIHNSTCFEGIQELCASEHDDSERILSGRHGSWAWCAGVPVSTHSTVQSYDAAPNGAFRHLFIQLSHRRMSSATSNHTSDSCSNRCRFAICSFHCIHNLVHRCTT